MVHNIAITKARINLGALAKRAYLKGEYFILEKDGIPIAGIMSSDEMEDYLELRDPAVSASIRKSNADVRAGRFVSAEGLLAEAKAYWAKKDKQKKKKN
jgi:hypothetical protein